MSNLFDLSGKIALVTGASRGIGKTISMMLAQQGAFVVGTATTEAGAQQITQAFEQNQLSGQGMVLDLSSPESIQQLVAQMEKSCGVANILVNNAGITRDNLFLRMNDDEWFDVINVNLNSAYRLTKLHIKSMFRSKWGRIINLTSVIGYTGNVGQTNYAAAKAGIVGFTKSLAKEFAKYGITVNAVAPGFIDTDMIKKLPEEYREQLLTTIPAGRVGTPEEIASAVVYLASPQASYITGQTLHINGGMFAV